MKKKDIHSYKNKYLAVCIIISIICPLGIPLIPIGFVMFTPIWIAAASLGIALAAFGFYGIPLFWVAYGTARRRTRVYDAINVEYLYNVMDISTQTTIQPATVRDDITWLMNKKYLVGFLFDGANLSLNENKQLKKKGFEFSGTCPHCGGTRAVKKEDGIYCAFCNSQLHFEE